MKHHVHALRTFATRHKKRVLLVSGCLLVLSLLLIAGNYIMIGRHERYILHDHAGVSQILENQKPIAIVLGGGILDGQPRPLLQDRLDAAAALLKSGSVRKVIVSGDNRFPGYNEPSVMRDYLIRQHSIDPVLIQPDFAGRSTYETCERARKVFDLNKALLVSESTHLPRAIYLCRSFGVQAYGYQSDGQSSAGHKIGQRWREILARTKATINIYIIGEKTILGDKP